MFTIIIVLWLPSSCGCLYTLLLTVVVYGWSAWYVAATVTAFDWIVSAAPASTAGTHLRQPSLCRPSSINSSSRVASLISHSAWTLKRSLSSSSSRAATHQLLPAKQAADSLTAGIAAEAAEEPVRPAVHQKALSPYRLLVCQPLCLMLTRLHGGLMLSCM